METKINHFTLHCGFQRLTAWLESLVFEEGRKNERNNGNAAEKSSRDEGSRRLRKRVDRYVCMWNYIDSPRV